MKYISGILYVDDKPLGKIRECDVEINNNLIWVIEGRLKMPKIAGVKKYTIKLTLRKTFIEVVKELFDKALTGGKQR